MSNETTRPSGPLHGLETLNAFRRGEGRRIDPTTAELTWQYGQVLDPYAVDPNLPEECHCVGRVYFARRPGGGMWICFDDLPDATVYAIWKRIRKEGRTGEFEFTVGGWWKHPNDTPEFRALMESQYRALMERWAAKRA
jgi:hypothetical protein